MIAIQISSFGGPEVLKPIEVPKPSPGQQEVVVRVEAAGIARADLHQRQGKYPPPKGASEIPGLDLAGTVDAVGSGITSWKKGDRVCAILTGGGYAEYCAVPSVQMLPIPENWTATEAATLPENLFTVFDNLITRAGLVKNEIVLIHGGTSGIGSMAIMLARAWEATPIATAGTHEKCEACLSFGAAQVINYKEIDFVSEIERITGGKGVDVVLDMVGGPYLSRNLDALSHDGRVAIVATQGGKIAELDIGKLMNKRARIISSTMRARSPQAKGEIAQRLLREVWPLLPAKDPIRPIIDSRFPLTDARRAHERMESGAHIGKIVLVT